MPANTVAVRAHTDHAVRTQSSANTSRAGHYSGWLNPRRPSEQRPEKRPQLSSLPPQWLAEPTPTKREKATVAPSHVVPATICLVGLVQPATVVAGTKGEVAALTSVCSVGVG